MSHNLELVPTIIRTRLTSAPCSDDAPLLLEAEWLLRAAAAPPPAGGDDGGAEGGEGLAERMRRLCAAPAAGIAVDVRAIFMRPCVFHP